MNTRDYTATEIILLRESASGSRSLALFYVRACMAAHSLFSLEMAADCADKAAGMTDEHKEKVVYIIGIKRKIIETKLKGASA